MSDIDFPLVVVCVSVLGGSWLVKRGVFDHDSVSE